MMQTQTTERPAAAGRASVRPMAPLGGVPLLLVVALAVATPAMGVQTVLADLGATPGSVERSSGLRLISGTIAKLVRGVSGRVATQRPARPGPTWVDRGSGEGAGAIHPGRHDGAAARGLVRVALLDLPPPARA